MEILFADKEESLGFLILDEGKMSQKIEEAMKEAKIEPMPCSVKGNLVKVVPISRLSKFPEIPYILWDNPIIGDENGRIFHITSILLYRKDTRCNYLTFGDLKEVGSYKAHNP